MTGMKYLKKHPHIWEYLALKASPKEKNRIEFHLRVKMKAIYFAIK